MISASNGLIKCLTLDVDTILDVGCGLGHHTDLFKKEGKTIATKIYSIEILDTDEHSFSVSTDNKEYIHVSTPHGKLSIVEFQPAGKRNMTVIDYLKGNSFEDAKLLINPS